ncbi:MAG TPA: hypothetical protein VFR11_15400 [Micromonosporaceae bacterium]|jgi:hypothetical protein|nr:hypothetical protein [Micromonosporaceae bacterium]
MPDRGQDLGADLYHLWLAGKQDLPSVADQYGAAAESVEDTGYVAAVMWRPARFGGDDYGPVFRSWTALRDEFQTILADTATNLTLTGTALCLAANEYAKSDKDAAAEMHRLMRVDGGAATAYSSGPDASQRGPR